MDEIARDLGMGKASLYYYFPTKESLFRAVIVAEQDEFILHAATLVAGSGTASDRIYQYIERRLDYFQRTMILSKFSVQTYSEIRPVFDAIMEDFSRRELQFLRQILESGNRDGEFAVENPEEVARILLRVLRGLRVLMFKSGAGEEPDNREFQTLRQETKAAMGIFLRGIRPEHEHSSTASTEGKPH
jgi:TetR/AcrR family transcriptional repressor of mexJK operon